MSILSQLSPSMQQFADVTKAAIKLDMDIFDDQLIRVAGTGVARDSIGHKIQEKGVVNRHIFAGQDQIIIDDPGNEDNCRECAHFGRCVYKKAVYAAIKHKGRAIGAMGILAFDEEQAALLEERKFEHLAFIRQIASLMESKIKDFMTTRALRHEIAGGLNTIALPDIVGESPAFMELIGKIKRLADSRSTILLHGETGTGKEVFSRALHAESHRKNKPFMAINCGAIPENLIETELFGYEKGAFTGADKYGKHGRLYHGNGGTILLDEVENMPLYMQQKLLRVLETRQVDRIGGNRPVAIDGRFIVATNKNLEDMVARGTFREDLFHRINVISLEIPSLRERGGDVIVLARHFINQYNAILGCRIMGMTAQVHDFFMNYQWPGNVRELQNTIEYAMNMETCDEIRFENLPHRLQHRPKSGSTLEALERDAIREALSRFGRHNEGKEKAAVFLGISRSTIYRKIRKYNLD